ncbi:MAG TPA: hypothetical protein VF974_06025 [Patescibacteria group bacterium]
MNDEERAQVKNNFLEAYAATGNILLSCKSAGINRSTFYDWQEKDEEFSLRWHQAERDFADVILAEFVQRAVHGYEKPVISMGRVVYEDVPVLDQHGNQVVNDLGRPLFDKKPLMERVVSDSLLALAIKKHHPEYREKQQIDTTVTNVNATMQQLHEAIEKSLAPFPEARIALAEAILGVNNGKR